MDNKEIINKCEKTAIINTVAIGLYNYFCLTVFIMLIMTYFENFVRYNELLTIGLMALWLIVTNVIFVAFEGAK